MKRLLCQLWAAAWLLIGVQAIAAEQGQPLVVFAAASLTDVLQKASDAYTQSSATPVRLSFAASSALAKQIESGAPADVFVSADQEWMDYIAGKDLINAASRSNLLGNRLALIAPADSKVTLQLAANARLLAALGEKGRLATGDPDTVPVGKYAKAALTSFGIWSALEPRLARAENVRVALSYVARGEAPLGIVYATDATVEPKVRVVALFPESSHPAITYPAAATRSAQAGAAGYLQFLRGPIAADIFRKAGFTLLTAQPAMVSGCSGFAFDVSYEQQLLGSPAAEIKAGAAASKAALVEPGKAYRVQLVRQQATKFAATPAKRTAAEGSFAGILELKSGKRRAVRISLSGPAWIDVVSGGKALASTRHTGSHDCASLRKSVEFAVEPGAKLLLQLSGSSESALNLVVTSPLIASKIDP